MICNYSFYLDGRRQSVLVKMMRVDHLQDVIVDEP